MKHLQQSNEEHVISYEQLMNRELMNNRGLMNSNTYSLSTVSLITVGDMNELMLKSLIEKLHSCGKKLMN